MAESDHVDSAVNEPETKADSPTTKRRRVRRQAGPPAGQATQAAPPSPVADDESTEPDAASDTAVPAPAIPRKPMARKPGGKPIARKPTGRRPARKPSVGAAATGPSLTKQGSPGPGDVDEPAVSVGASGYREERRQRVASRAVPAVRRRRTDRRLLVIWLAVGVTAVLLVAALVASILFAVASSNIDDRRDQRAEFVSFARKVAIDMATLSPETVDDTVRGLKQELSGKALQQVPNLEATAPVIKEDKVRAVGSVVTAAVSRSDDTSATVLLVAGSERTLPGEQTSYDSYRWKFEVTKINGDLKVTNIELVA